MAMGHLLVNAASSCQTGRRKALELPARFIAIRPYYSCMKHISALDIRTKQSIQESMHFLKCNKTIIMVIHRLGTMLIWERTIIPGRGAIVQDGSYSNIILCTEKGIGSSREQTK